MRERLLTIKEKVPFIIIDNTDLFNSYSLCNYKLTRPSTNLNCITIKSNLKSKLDKYPKKYNIDVYYDGKLMKMTKYMGKGSFGEVLLFEIFHKGKLRSTVVKKPLKDANPYEEPEILKNYLENAYSCKHYIIPIKAVKDQHENPFIIMQEANGEVFNLNMDPRLKIKVIIQLAKIVKCFFEKKLVYVDLKLENLLYKCDNDKVEFFLGDIGSFEKLNSTDKDRDEYMSLTFVPPEYAFGDKKYRKADRQTALFTLGATIADLYDLTEDLNYEKENGDKKTSKDFKNIYIPQFRKKIINSNIPEKVKEIILAFTEYSPAKRLKYNFDLVFENLCPGK